MLTITNILEDNPHLSKGGVKIAKTRVKSHVLEKVIGALMAIFGIAAIMIFLQAVNREGILYQDAAMILMLLIVMLAILAQTIVLIRIYEQHE